MREAKGRKEGFPPHSEIQNTPQNRPHIRRDVPNIFMGARSCSECL